MYGIGELLFGQLNGAGDQVFTALRIIGALGLCAALVLLAQRREWGWWLAAGAFVLSAAPSFLAFSSLTSGSPVTLVFFVLGVTVPLFLSVGVAIYGLLSFQRLPRSDGAARIMTVRQFRGTDVVGPAVMALVYAGASFIPFVALFISYSGTYSGLPVATILLSGLLYGLLPAGLLGLAHRSRWAWFLIMIAAIVAIFSTALSAQGAVLIFLSLLQAVLAFYGWQRWAGTQEPVR